MDRSIRRLFYFFVALFVGLILMLTYVQVWAAPSLKVNAANTRAVEEEMKIERGLILSADGEQLAKNRQEGQYYLREYPLGSLTSPWLGLQQPPLRPGRHRTGLQRGAHRPDGAPWRDRFLEPGARPEPARGRPQAHRTDEGPAGRGEGSGRPQRGGGRPRSAHRRHPRHGVVPRLRSQRDRFAVEGPSSPIPTGLSSTGLPPASIHRGRCSR